MNFDKGINSATLDHALSIDATCDHGLKNAIADVIRAGVYGTPEELLQSARELVTEYQGIRDLADFDSSFGSDPELLKA